jgi:hypothetical protein
MRNILNLLLFVPCSFLLVVSYAYDISCETINVQIGATKAEVLTKYGSPTYETNWAEEQVDAVYDPQEKIISEEKKLIYQEEWAYNYGPKRLMTFLTFTDDRITRIEKGGYGFSGELSGIPTSQCAQKIKRGDRKIEVLMRCGSPTATSRRPRSTSETRLEKGNLHKTEIFWDLEEWLYNFGSNRMAYTIIFEKGRVSKVIQEGRGY